jgi:hypothetical protein
MLKAVQKEVLGRVCGVKRNETVRSWRSLNNE